MNPIIKTLPLALAASLLSATPAMADDDDHGERDFGAMVEHLLHAQSDKLFGIKKPLNETSEPDIRRAPDQSVDDLMFLAEGLKAEIFSRDVAHKWDQMDFWPNAQNPTHLVACIEEFNRQTITPYPNGNTRYNPSVQTIDLETGEVRTVLRGMAGCDGIRVTPWRTVLVTEEDGSTSGDGHLGGAYEILDPLAFEEGNLVNRRTSDVVDPNGNAIVGQVAYRGALPTISWEGIAVLPNGVVIAGDELRPGSYADGLGSRDTDGGAIFKFVPSVPHQGGPIHNLGDSPLAAGTVYAMQVSCRDDRQQAGQGCEVGNAAWVLVDANDARADANLKGATGYYRPEDLHRDPMYMDESNPDAVRFCWANTGNEDASNFAEVVCGIDSDPMLADADTLSVVVNRLVEGDRDMSAFDNLAFQPKTGNLYVVEDDENGDVWACLPDGADRDIKSDGCVKILRLKDQSAEPTGFIFSADGRSAYVNIQHSDDPTDGSMNRDGWGTDDLIKITGFKVK
ncbi:MAG: hypothetical protein Kow0073_12420 [Immundisolibacter sp.]